LLLRLILRPITSPLSPPPCSPPVRRRFHGRTDRGGCTMGLRIQRGRGPWGSVLHKHLPPHTVVPEGTCEGSCRWMVSLVCWSNGGRGRRRRRETRRGRRTLKSRTRVEQSLYKRRSRRKREEEENETRRASQASRPSPWPWSSQRLLPISVASFLPVSRARGTRASRQHTWGSAVHESNHA